MLRPAGPFPKAELSAGCLVSSAGPEGVTGSEAVAKPQGGGCGETLDVCVCAFPEHHLVHFCREGAPDSALSSVAPPPRLPRAAQTGPSALLSHSFPAAPPRGLPYGPCSPRSFSSVGPLASPGMEFGLSYSRVWGVSHWAVPLGCECPPRPPGTTKASSQHRAAWPPGETSAPLSTLEAFLYIK